MPPKRVKKPKKPVQQKQKQKQSQRVVVNVNQSRPQKRRPVARARQPQQVVYQPLITMNGSVPVPTPSYNPIQSTGGFNPTPTPPSLGTPISSSAPVELPVFANESVKVVGDEAMTAPILKPVDIIVPIKPVIPDDRPVVMPKPRAPPMPIITSPPPSLVSDGSNRSKFIIPARPPPPARSEMKPTDDSKSVSTLLSEISKDSGINSQSIADFLFKKKKEPVVRPPVRIQVPKSDISVSTGNESDTSGYETAGQAVADAVKQNRAIARRNETGVGFNIPSDGSISSDSIIIGNAPPISSVSMSSGSSGKTKKNPYDPFTQSESSVGGLTVSDVEQSKPIKKRSVTSRVVAPSSDTELSESGSNIIPQDAPAGRRLPPTKVAPVKLETIKEKKSSYVSKADLQAIAKSNSILLKRPNGKEKTMNELRIEIAGK